MKTTFYKYQGTGNDFIIIDNRLNIFNKNNTKQIAECCDRRFGIGADGLILLENDPVADFKMVYYNSDGNESSMCGNGGRCIMAFAKFLGLIEKSATFRAIDGIHHAKIEGNLVHLQMSNVDTVESFDDHVFLDTGSPHHITTVNELESLDVKSQGARIRYGEPYNEIGSNVNFVKKINDYLFAVRTYERGVEDETLSCGTGVTAVAIAMYHQNQTKETKINLKTPGGELKVVFNKKASSYVDIWLIGPAVMVFKGEMSW